MLGRKFFTLALLAFVAPSVGTAWASTVPPADTGITITSPLNDETIVNTRLAIQGTAPPVVLISVIIVDTDRDRTGAAQQPNGRVDGSVTSDGEGLWVFVAPVAIVPGEFEVRASYTTAANQTIDSAPVQFVMVNEDGASSIPSSSMKLKIAVPLVIVLAGAFLLVYRWRARRRPSRSDEPSRVRRNRRQAGSRLARFPESDPLFLRTDEGRAYQREQVEKLRSMDDEMKRVERALAETATSLERSNTIILGLRRQIHVVLAASDAEVAEQPAAAVDPEPDVVEAAAHAELPASPRATNAARHRPRAASPKPRPVAVTVAGPGAEAEAGCETPFEAGFEAEFETEPPRATTPIGHRTKTKLDRPDQ